MSGVVYADETRTSYKLRECTQNFRKLINLKAYGTHSQGISNNPEPNRFAAFSAPHSHPFWSKYSPQHSIFKYPKPAFLTILLYRLKLGNLRYFPSKHFLFSTFF